MRVLPRILRAFSALVLVVVVLALAFVWRANAAKRSIPGRIVRWYDGETGAYQTVNDLAEDIRQLPALAQLQRWGIDTLSRFRSGQIRTNRSASFWSPGSVWLAKEEWPSFITQQWGQTNRWGPELPDISIRVSTNGQPECLVIAWYLHGIVVGPPEYRLSFQPWCQAKAMPGVFVYHLYK